MTGSLHVCSCGFLHALTKLLSKSSECPFAGRLSRLETTHFQTPASRPKDKSNKHSNDKFKKQLQEPSSSSKDLEPTHPPHCHFRTWRLFEVHVRKSDWGMPFCSSMCLILFVWVCPVLLRWIAFDYLLCSMFHFLQMRGGSCLSPKPRHVQLSHRAALHSRFAFQPKISVVRPCCQSSEHLRPKDLVQSFVVQTSCVVCRCLNL